MWDTYYSQDYIDNLMNPFKKYNLKPYEKHKCSICSKEASIKLYVWYCDECYAVLTQLKEPLNKHIIKQKIIKGEEIV